MAPERPPARGSPPRTLQRLRRTPTRRRSQSPVARSLYACSDDDAMLSNTATATLKIRIHLPSY